MAGEQPDTASDTSPSREPSYAHHDKVLAAPVLHFELRAELHELHGQQSYNNGDPTGKTLVKEPDLRIVLLALKAGGRMDEHRASGPISIQGIDGRFTVDLPSGEVELTAGELVALEPNVPHGVKAIEDSVFLLTIGRTTYQHVSDHHESGS
jgi:quercetin dioxygenase-like cupin family protein